MRARVLLIYQMQVYLVTTAFVSFEELTNGVTDVAHRASPFEETRFVFSPDASRHNSTWDSQDFALTNRQPAVCYV
jgi:hypothetical protein